MEGTRMRMSLLTKGYFHILLRMLLDTILHMDHIHRNHIHHKDILLRDIPRMDILYKDIHQLLTLLLVDVHQQVILLQLDTQHLVILPLVDILQLGILLQPDTQHLVILPLVDILQRGILLQPDTQHLVILPLVDILQLGTLQLVILVHQLLIIPGYQPHIIQDMDLVWEHCWLVVQLLQLPLMGLTIWPMVCTILVMGPSLAMVNSSTASLSVGSLERDGSMAYLGSTRALGSRDGSNYSSMSNLFI